MQVLKFGGTSLQSPDLRHKATSRVREALMQGWTPVVVVSAFGRRGDPYATDTLVDLAQGVDPEVPSREVAMLASCGEVLAMVVMASVFRHAGIQAVALTGAQAGIKTVGDYTGAHIQSVEVGALVARLRQGCVPVIAGFQGAMASGEVTTLDRGGSDISSTALGYALQAEHVDIYTDVPGVMTADPRLVRDARLIETLTFEQALLLAHQGAKVIHPEAVEWARRGSLTLYVRSLSTAGQGTRIAHGPASVRANGSAVGIACKPGDASGSAVVSVVGALSPESASLLQVTRTILSTTGVPCMALEATSGVVMATVPVAQMAVAAHVLHAHFLPGRTAEPYAA